MRGSGELSDAMAPPVLRNSYIVQGGNTAY